MSTIDTVTIPYTKIGYEVTMDDEELDRSRVHGSVHLWRVAEQYEILDGAVTPVAGRSHRWRSYAPFAFPELPVELAKLTQGDEKAVLDFSHKWGLLGYNNLLVYDTPDISEAIRRRGPHGGDPLDWIWSHACTVTMVLYLLDSRQQALERGEPGILRDALFERAEPHAAVGVMVGIPFARGSFQNPDAHFLQGDLDNPNEMLAKMLKEVLEPNLQYFKEALVIGDGGVIRRSRSFLALLPVIYSYLADACVGSHFYIQCRFCNRYFLQTDPRQRYCPNPPGMKGESLCSLKARKRKLGDKRRQEMEIIGRKEFDEGPHRQEVQE